MTSQAIAAGATVRSPVTDQYYGNREGGVTGPFGIVWWITTRKEDVAPEDIQRRAAALYGGA